jgi:hypothetical protein
MPREHRFSIALLGWPLLNVDGLLSNGAINAKQPAAGADPEKNGCKTQEISLKSLLIRKIR